MQNRYVKISNRAIITLYNMKNKFPLNSTIIFDIDDTILDIDGNIIQSVMNIYNYAKKLKLFVIFITARSADMINETKKQFKDKNIDYTYMFFRPNNVMNVWKYKRDCREYITKSGFNVIMSIGDKIWDTGEFGGIGVVLRDIP